MLLCSFSNKRDAQRLYCSEYWHFFKRTWTDAHRSVFIVAAFHKNRKFIYIFDSDEASLIVAAATLIPVATSTRDALAHLARAKLGLVTKCAYIIVAVLGRGIAPVPHPASSHYVRWHQRFWKSGQIYRSLRILSITDSRTISYILGEGIYSFPKPNGVREQLSARAFSGWKVFMSSKLIQRYGGLMRNTFVPNIGWNVRKRALDMGEKYFPSARDLARASGRHLRRVRLRKACGPYSIYFLNVDPTTELSFVLVSRVMDQVPCRSETKGAHGYTPSSLLVKQAFSEQAYRKHQPLRSPETDRCDKAMISTHS
ncbi:uncharacterized protein BT62DRAFT_1000989 [Guyanagaster necrorhizus]|uniref:Uncharacterized protein n=1 Tax=Guyanagaster necrorhizus TaxID=856835 RepID=A0A9P8AW28_9AGAR|nr:uncharacterized protein BT62DRAFT_1000989 [Guyanagaster necrorhizus MCA 3950]KAG7450138.1 hypothetical protein BT62DRAFT_1000989 [Guyanagaster necrorhizus MCA 3950]